MTDTVGEMVKGGLQPELIWTLIQLMITFFIVLWLKGIITDYSDYRKVRGNKRIALGAWLRIGTSTGFVDCKIMAINPGRVLLEGEDVIIDIPIHSFMTMQKGILKRSPEVGNAEAESDEG